MNMTTTPSIPQALNRHLSANSTDDARSLALYLDHGAPLVTPEAFAALSALRHPLRTKIDGLINSERLRQRLEILATYFEETESIPSTDAAVRREVAFALFYFLKGFDRIPDSVPELGLVDDAFIVDLVLQRHAAVLRLHWIRHERIWSEKL